MAMRQEAAPRRQAVDEAALGAFWLKLLTEIAPQGAVKGDYRLGANDVGMLRALAEKYPVVASKDPVFANLASRVEGASGEIIIYKEERLALAKSVRETWPGMFTAAGTISLKVDLTPMELGIIGLDRSQLAAAGGTGGEPVALSEDQAKKMLGKYLLKKYVLPGIKFTGFIKKVTGEEKEEEKAGAGGRAAMKAAGTEAGGEKKPQKKVKISGTALMLERQTSATATQLTIGPDGMFLTFTKTR